MSLLDLLDSTEPDYTCQNKFDRSLLIQLFCQTSLRMNFIIINFVRMKRNVMFLQYYVHFN